MDAAERHQHNEWYKPAEREPNVRTFVEASADEELDLAAAAALHRAATCDAPLHLDGLRLSGLLTERQVADAGVPVPGSEGPWLSEVQARLIASSRC